MMEGWEILIPNVCGFGLHFILDGFRLVYTLIAVLMWTVSAVFSREYMAHYANRRRYYRFLWITFFATVGVFLSADLMTIFIFFEIMSLTSYVWVAFDEKPDALRAAETYLAVAIIGGMVMLMGLFLLSSCLQTLEFGKLSHAVQAALERGEKGRLYVAGVLLLFGFGAKAGAFPLHIWLPKAHPVAPAPASALLSGILTKTGIFGIIVISMQIFVGDGLWALLIVVLGLVTMFLGALLALFSINLKRTLACSSVSQIGFILVGIGMATALSFAGENPSIAVRGTFLHMVNHSLFKLVLFLCAGAVYMKLHQLDLNEIRGYGRNKPVLLFCFLMGAAGISGIPGFSGYISKTLLHESIVEYQKILAAGELLPPVSPQALPGLSGLYPIAAQALGSLSFWKAAEWIFLITGGMTLAYMLKLFIALFIEKHPTRQEEFDRLGNKDMKRSSKAALLLPALLLPLMGLLPTLTMNHLAGLGQGFFTSEKLEHSVAYFSLENLKGGLTSILIGLLLYRFILQPLFTEKPQQAGQPRRYINRWPQALDLENLLYRPLLQKLLPGFFGALCQYIDCYIIDIPLTIFLAVSAVICRGMDHLADSLILLARKTSHRQLKEKALVSERYWLARKLGALSDIRTQIKHRIPGNQAKHPAKTQPQVSQKVLELIEWEASWKKTGRLIQESFSFGLMLFCIGLCLTLGYLFYVFLR